MAGENELKIEIVEGASPPPMAPPSAYSPTQAGQFEQLQSFANNPQRTVPNVGQPPQRADASIASDLSSLRASHDVLGKNPRDVKLIADAVNDLEKRLVLAREAFANMGDAGSVAAIKARADVTNLEKQVGDFKGRIEGKEGGILGTAKGITDALGLGNISTILEKMIDLRNLSSKSAPRETMPSVTPIEAGDVIPMPVQGPKPLPFPTLAPEFEKYGPPTPAPAPPPFPSLSSMPPTTPPLTTSATTVPTPKTPMPTPAAGGAAGAAAGAAGGAGTAGAALGGLAAAAAPAAGVLAVVEAAAKVTAAAFNTAAGGIQQLGATAVKIAGNDYMGAFISNVDFAADSLEQIPIIGQVWASELRLAVAPIKAFTATVNAFVDRGRELSGYSGHLAGATAQADVRSMMADINEAQQLGPKMAELIELQSKIETEFRDFMIPIKKSILEAILPILQEILNTLRLLKPVSGLIGETNSAITGFFGNMLKLQPEKAFEAIIDLPANIAKRTQEAKERAEADKDALFTIGDIQNDLRTQLNFYNESFMAKHKYDTGHPVAKADVIDQARRGMGFDW